jgi:putative intracellular protease/amidase
VCTSAHMLQDHPTGLWIEEAATPYYMFKKAGYSVILASPKGGPIPIDSQSVMGPFFTQAAKDFMHDREGIHVLSHSEKLSEIDMDSVDALYVTGGHGACADLVDDPALRSAIEKLYANDKIVAADCHGPVCLAGCKKPDGTPLVAGKIVTAFTNTEEAEVMLSNKVPFLLEDRFKEQGATFERGMDWSSNVRVDGKLVTGQNPQSSEECAQAVINLLSGNAM